MARLEILLVDDDPVEADAVERALRHTGVDAHVKWVTTVAAGLDALEHEAFDCVLVDYRLPDGSGLDFLRAGRARSESPCPMILLTVVQDEAIGLAAIEEGAQDYLIKSEISGPLLARAIRYAIERARLLEALIARHEAESHAREVHTLSRLATSEPTPHTTRAFGIRSLSEGAPSAFESLRASYAEIIDLALDQRAFEVDHHVSERLQRLADVLGSHHAGPRDVVELHSVVLRAADAAGSGSKLKVLAEEARLLVLELMGYLTQYYRSGSIRSDALRPRNLAPERQP